MAYQRKTKRLGDMLIECGKITQEQLGNALKEQHEKKMKLGEALISLGYVSQDEINDILCEQLDIEYVNLRKANVDEVAVHMVNEQVVRKYTLIPFAIDSKMPNTLNVAMDNPMDIMAIDDVSIITGMTIQPFLSNTNEISAMIDKFFGATKAEAMAARFKEEQLNYEEKEDEDELEVGS